MLKVSIVIPVYRVSAYIERCLYSVMNQTYSVFECIIVDDSTDDDSIEKCERMLSSYKGAIRFVILHHEKNRGLSAARNTGLKAATGEYIFFLDSDDVITDDCIEKLMETASQDLSVEMVQGNAKTYNNSFFDNRTKHYSQRHAESNENVRTLFYRNHEIPVYAWNKLIKRSFLFENHLFFHEGLLWED